MSILPTNQSDNHIFILHPDFTHKGLYISELMNHYQIVYTQFPVTLANSQDALDWIHQNQQPIRQANTHATVLILDEMDHLPSKILSDVLLNFIDCSDLYILIITRSMLDVSVFDDDIQHHMQVLMPTYPKTDSPSAYILDVMAFGVGRVRLNGYDIDLIPNETTHDLLFYALENRVTTREQILSTLWGHLDTKSAIANFHVTRQKLDEKLGVEFLVVQAGYYQINPQITINYDVDSYRKLLQNVSYPVSNHQEQPYQSAYDYYHHDFLLKSTASWITTIRTSLRKIQSDVCYHLATLHTPSLKAIGLLSQAFRYNPYQEDIAHVMMIIYRQAGLPCDALTVYQALKDNLSHLGEIQPAKPLTQLMQDAENDCYS